MLGTIADRQRLRRTIEHQVALLLGQIAPGRIQAKVMLLRQGLGNCAVPLAIVHLLAPGGNRPIANAQFGMSDHQLGIDLLLRAQTRAGRAGTMRTVEAERARSNLRQTDPAVDAGKLLREENLLTIDNRDQYHPIAQLERRLQRVGHALAKRCIGILFFSRLAPFALAPGLHIVERRPLGHHLILLAAATIQPAQSPLPLADHQTVNDHLDRVLLLLIQLDLIAQIVDLAIHPHAHIARPAHLLKNIFVLTLAPLHQRRQQHNPRTGGQVQHRIYNLLHRLLADLASAVGTMGMPHARVEQAQIVVDLGHSANGRARIMRRALLIDRNRRREAVDMIHIRLLHAVQELARIGR